MVTILNASPRKGGINDRICEELGAGLTENAIISTSIKLADLTIKACSNCRECMKKQGLKIGQCHITDDMGVLIESLLGSECIIVTAPINCYDLPSGFKVMLERLAVFCYWSDDMYAPKVRESLVKRNGFLITTSALPGIMVPFLTSARKTFRLFTKPIGITKMSYCHLGFKGRKTDHAYNNKDMVAVDKIVAKIASLSASKSILK